MSDPFIGEIRAVGFDFAPRGWALCDGSLLPIPQNTALFSILGTTYGGNGTSTFGLPNLKGKMVIHPGRGPGLSTRQLGEDGGASFVTLNTNHLPAHNHAMMSINLVAAGSQPSGTTVLARSSGGSAYVMGDSVTKVQLSSDAVSQNGGGQPHNNLMPYLTHNFIIALQGVFPNRG